MSGGKFSDNQKGYRNYGSNRYNSNNNPGHPNRYKQDADTRFDSRENPGSRANYASTKNMTQNERYGGSYRNQYGNKNAYYRHSTGSYAGNTATVSYDHQNERQGSVSSYKQHDDAANASYAYRNTQNTQHVGSRVNKRMSSISPPTRSGASIDSLLESSAGDSLYGDILLDTAKYYKKLLLDKVLSEEEVLERIEKLKTSLTLEEYKDNLPETQVKRNHTILHNERVNKKCQLSKLAYDISLLHYQNIEDVIGHERKTLEDLSLR